MSNFESLIEIEPLKLNSNLDEMIKMGSSHKENYISAVPYPHIVFDDFLPKNIVENIIHEFPGGNESDIYHDKGYTGSKKRQISPYDCSAYNQRIFFYFNSPQMLAFLENLTGINGLIPDPYYLGGGFHETGRGGKLGIHTDFRLHEKLNLQRRLNLIVYLNKEWFPEYRGELEIWDEHIKNKYASIAPIFNRCVIFNTDDKSFHGHPDPLNCPDDIFRRSLALYYYSASDEIYKTVPNLSTIYQARSKDDLKDKLRARYSRLGQTLKQILPPVIYRYLLDKKNN